jgi:hypothetical protein
LKAKEKKKRKKTVKTKALAVEKALPQVNVQTTAGLMQLALQSNAGIEQLQKLVEMKYKDEEREARKDFFFALSEFQANVGSMRKDKNVDFTSERTGKNTSYNYTTLGQIEKQIKEPLKNARLAKRFEIQDASTGMTVTCIITHTNGHSERTSMTAPADTSGSKNTIQSRASTVTYLQRYTLIGALGLVTADEDNDGGTSDKEPTPPTAHDTKPGDVLPPVKPDYVPDKNAFKSNPKLAPMINALKRQFAKLNSGKDEVALRSLWVDMVGFEGQLTEMRIKELAKEFTAELNKRSSHENHGEIS